MILLIEDNSGDVMLFNRALADTPSECVVAQTAQNGIEALERGGADFSVVVVDIRLPSVDGWAVLEHLRDNPYPGIEPVVLTSSSYEDDRRRAVELGCAHYWTKPEEFQSLRDIVLKISAMDSPGAED